jgi:aryl-alcohol dehydrogenase-like predicted oxidoreductase
MHFQVSDRTENKHVRSLPQGAIRYVTGRPGVATVIIGTTRIAHLHENIAALESLPFANQELARLRGERCNVQAERRGLYR